MDEFLDDRLRLGILACVGGFTAGYAANAAVSALAQARYDDETTSMESKTPGYDRCKEYGRLLFDNAEFRNENVTAFSDITALVGCASDNRTMDEATKDDEYFDIMQNYPNISKNRTLMAKYLTPSIYEAYWNVETCYGFTFDSAIQTGLDVSQFSNCGFVAGDEDVFNVFENFVDPILTEKHNGFRRGVHKHVKCLDPEKLQSDGCLKLDSAYVESVSFTTGRSLSGYRFLPACNRAERREIEAKLCNVFQALGTVKDIDFSGEYLSLEDRSSEISQALPPDSPCHWVDKPVAPVYTSAGITRDWPDARGLFICRSQGVFASVNRDDHLRIFCRENHADVARLFTKFCLLHRELERKMADEGMKFAQHEDYGYLLWYPSVIGTGLKVCISVRLKHLSQHGRLFEIMKRLRLRFNFSQEAAKARDGWMEVYNGDRLGVSEVELTEMVANGVGTLVEMEKQLEKRQPIEEEMPKQKRLKFHTVSDYLDRAHL